MRVLCAPDSFKESIDAASVAEAMAEGIRRARPDALIDLCPVSDGGEGLIDTLLVACEGEIHDCTVLGPRGRDAAPVNARFAVFDDGRVGVVELAEASGLTRLKPADRDPTRTTTYGTGQLIGAVLQCGVSEIILGLGGSATVDGGCGLAQALGTQFFDDADRLIETPITGAMLESIGRIEPAPDPPHLRVACDVDNPLCGPGGAATVYGPQKGATPAQVTMLEAGLAHLATLTDADADLRGTGAAGGAGFGLATWFGASLESGTNLVLDRLQFDERCRRATLVLTGEGTLDAQSLRGKACLGVATRARALGASCMAIVGRTGPGAEETLAGTAGGSLDGYVSLVEAFNETQALRNTTPCIASVAQAIVSYWPESAGR